MNTEKINTPPFNTVDFSNGKYVGDIRTGVGLNQVWKIDNKVDLVSYAAIDTKKGPTKPLSIIEFNRLSQNKSILVAIRAYTNPNYTGKGIASELFLFVRNEGYMILSDTHLSDDGEKLWNSLIKSGKFKPWVIDAKTLGFWELSDIGLATTTDGLIVKSPKDDYNDHTIYDPSTDTGQRFFYLLEKSEQLIAENRGMLSRYPNRYFGIGYD